MARARVVERLWGLLAFLTVCFFSLGQGRTLCERGKPDCIGPSCQELVECDHGMCGSEGECECLPCYSGPACSTYDDAYGPRFAVREDTVIINTHHRGVVYKAVAEDEDLGFTCPLGPGLNTRCPCAAIHYSLVAQDESLGGIFTIHDSSGQVFLQPGVVLEPGKHYKVHIVASNACDAKREPDHPMMDVQTLTVVVRIKDSLQGLLQQVGGREGSVRDSGMAKTSMLDPAQSGNPID
ncbi:uncharacterized protein [Panulirus ornatus]|uniref:uncharacterized protein isoform X2 n=1 Tax=Panulirus ornatus TaxID=150431 RepID=UPI003A8B1E63